jgi:sulfate permease, SulP family
MRNHSKGGGPPYDDLLMVGRPKAVGGSHRHVRPHPGDVLAGFTVALVLIPQSVVFAQLVGVPPERGLYVAAFATMAAAPFASSPYLQTGPVGITALLTLGATAGLATRGTPTYVGLVTLLALVVGVVRLAVGLLRFGGVAYLMSQPVLAGFTPAAAIVLVATQVPALVGAEHAPGGIMRAAAWALVHPRAWEPDATLLGVGALILMLGGRRIHALFPGVLLAVGLSLFYSHTTGLHGRTLGTVHSSLPSLSLDLPWGLMPELLVPGIVIALVGFAEASTIARTYAAVDRAPWDANREFISQGVANLTAAAVGGFPVGGSLSRSALNRFAGARTHWAGAFTGVVVLAFLPFVPVLSELPLSVLAAVIIGAVSGLVRVEPLRQLWRFTRMQFTVAATTFVLTLALAPRVQLAVVIGVTLAVAAHLRREILISVPNWIEGDELHLKPKGVLYFASVPSLERTFLRLLGEHPSASAMVVHLDGLGRVDVTGALALQSLLAEATEAGLEARVADVPAHAEKILARVLHGARRRPPAGNGQGPPGGSPQDEPGVAPLR